MSKRDCIVSDALNDAERALSEVLERELSGGNHASTEAPPPPSTHLEDNDPDDLAAAFFAKQAKPPSLPVNEWARLILLRKNRAKPTTNDTVARKQD